MTHLIALAAAAAALCVPAAAWGSPDAVVRDCAADGSLDGGYSDADKQAALGRLTPELLEYSDCRSVIAASIGRNPRARSSASPDGGGAGGGSAEEPAKRRGAEREKNKGQASAAAREKAREAARDRRAAEVALGGRSLETDGPAAATSEDGGGGSSAPIGLALIAAGLIGGMFLLSRRSPRVADALRRVRFRR